MGQGRGYMNNGNNMSQSRNNNGCSGCSDISNDCKTMSRRLQTVEFSMYDTMLYLDIYPECKEALSYYHKLLEERDALRSALAKRCKRPTTAAENSCDESWDWIASPWPWEPSAN